jgi:hypothetical protein
MKSFNADVFVGFASAKFAAQAIRKAAEIGWRPLQFLNSVNSSIGAVIKPAGFENAQGIISTAYLMDPLDAQWNDDPGMKAFDKFLAKDFPEGNRADSLVVTGFNVAQTLVQVLKQCGDNLTRDNVMKEAANLRNFRTTNLLPGIRSTPVQMISRRSNRSSSGGSRARHGSCSGPCSAAKSDTSPAR